MGSSGWSSSAGMSSIETGVSDELRTYLLSRLPKTGNESSHVQGDFKQSHLFVSLWLLRTDSLEEDNDNDLVLVVEALSLASVISLPKFFFLKF